MWAFGASSLRELEGVHPDLIEVTDRALELSPIDFSVHDGLRYETEQAALVEAGASQTLRSQHLVQADGFGHAVDLVPYVNGRMRWEWGPIYLIANAVKRAALELEVTIRWGGCWTPLSHITDPERAVQDYIAEKLRHGQRAFADGPHYELVT